MKSAKNTDGEMFRHAYQNFNASALIIRTWPEHAIQRWTKFGRKLPPVYFTSKAK